MAIHNYIKVLLLTHLSTLSLKIALLTSSHTDSVDAAQNAWADISSNEVSGTGYTAGGQALSNVAVTQDDTDDEAELDADDPVWTGADGFTARYFAVYADTPTTPEADPVVCVQNFGADKQAQGGDFTLEIDASEGLINLG